MRDVVRHEEAVLEAMKRAQEMAPVPTVGDIAEGMEDLEVMAVDQGEPAQTEAQLRSPSQAGLAQAQAPQGCGKPDCCSSTDSNTDTGMCCSQGALVGFSSPSVAMVSFGELLSRCVELVMTLGLPQEFACHVQQLQTHDL